MQQQAERKIDITHRHGDLLNGRQVGGKQIESDRQTGNNSVGCILNNNVSKNLSICATGHI